MQEGVKYVIKGKVPSKGKNWIVGNASVGRYGPRLGLRKTPELMEIINAVAEGGYINLDIYEDDGGLRGGGRGQQEALPPMPDSSEIPF